MFSVIYNLSSHSLAPSVSEFLKFSFHCCLLAFCNAHYLSRLIIHRVSIMSKAFVAYA